MENIVAWMSHYGYAVLLLGSALELVAFGIPIEVLMSYAGFLISHGQLNWALCIFMAGLGSCIGMTIAYWIGYKLGPPFFHKYGRGIHLGPERLEKTSLWFNKYGNKLLIIAYFIPGVRHITGYFSGIMKMRFQTFAVYAYTGAFIWVGTFISLGKVLGPQWDRYHNSIKKYLLIAVIIAVVFFAFMYFYKKYKAQIKEWLTVGLMKGRQVFHSLWRIWFFVLTTTGMFLGSSVFMIGPI
ncbi:DedA family protein [Aneurinibacillus tyrosinisolvens]|uniref:DedA family protein n=1 Tax=Aneurinibacillus tyrosinisolvens TaxID=1443435 RepID=UPI0009E49C73|nr:DedA family protein [Aneurinibacillus tyrosinisolvens]